MREGSETEIETVNDFLVGVQGDSIVIMIPPARPMPKAKALRLAAWLVALADTGEERFPGVLQAVKDA